MQIKTVVNVQDFTFAEKMEADNVAKGGMKLDDSKQIIWRIRCY